MERSSRKRKLCALKNREKVIHAKKKHCPSHGHGDHKGHGGGMKSVDAQELSVDL